MPLDPKQQRQIMDLLIRSLEGQADHEELLRLRDILDASSEARDYYLRAVMAAECIRKMDWEAIGFTHEADGDKELNEQMWQAFSQEEKTAPAVEIPAIHKNPEQTMSPASSRGHPTVSKFSLYSLLLSSAALIFVIGYAYFFSIGKGVEVATLTDSIHARWADVAYSPGKGTRMVTGNDRWLLREGYAEVLFDNQTRVTLEGPVEFQILAEDRIGLNYGKVYASVPRAGAGFSVYTPNAKIIDLGTEFGVQVEISGNTQVHVLKGKTMLMAGKTDRVNMEINQGSAKKITGETGVISDIDCRTDYFVRVINSQAGSIWRGQNRIGLADIVGGGNGLGTGKVGMGIDPVSGRPSTGPWGTRQSANDYRLVPSSPYIDGVFVPNGQPGQIVSSQGHLFRECPVTSGLCCEHIISSPVRSLDSRVDQNQEITDSLAHSILLHANMGITFDLQAIRALVPGARIVGFQSQFGIRKWAIHPGASNADFWVLVDGQLRYEKKQVKINELNFVDIQLSESDRFLTLVQTDGGDPDGRTLGEVVLSPNDSDWGIFIDPILIVQ